MLAHKFSSPCFVSEHSDFAVGERILNQSMFLSVSLAFLLVTFVVIVLFAFADSKVILMGHEIVKLL